MHSEDGGRRFFCCQPWVQCIYSFLFFYFFIFLFFYLFIYLFILFIYFLFYIIVCVEKITLLTKNSMSVKSTRIKESNKEENEEDK